MARKKNNDAITHRTSIEWSDLKEQFIKAVDGNPKFPIDNAIVSQVNEWTRSPNRKNSWIGASLNDMRGWLADGYRAKPFEHAGDYIPRRKKRSIKFSEEGELQLDLVYSGHDYPYLDWEQRERKPGLRIVVDLCFACTTSAGTIEEYGAWVAGLLGTFEANGYDLEVDVAFPLRSAYQDDGGYGGPNSGPRSLTMIRVKKPNEASDFTEWSALFSPGGFRMLGFFALGMGAKKLNKKLGSGLGYPENNGWLNEWKPEERTLYLWTPNQPDYVPIEDLTQQVKNHGLI